MNLKSKYKAKPLKCKKVAGKKIKDRSFRIKESKDKNQDFSKALLMGSNTL